MRTVADTRRHRLLEIERSAVWVRWFGTAFALLQIYSGTRLDPSKLSWEAPVAYGLVGVLGVGNLVVTQRRRSEPGEERSERAIRRSILGLLVADHAILIALVWLMASGSAAAVWPLLFLLPVEAAVCGDLAGAFTSVAVVSIAELGRVMILHPAHPFAPSNITGFAVRTGIVAVIGLMAGLLVHSLDRDREEAALRVAQLKEFAVEKEHLALHDTLTDLPNRIRFRERLDDLLLAPRADGSLQAVLMMDLDRFKDINDTLGHPTGDRLLVQLAQRLACLPAGDYTVARLGGDEFGILLPHVRDPENAVREARRVLGLLDDPILLDGVALHVEASIGIALRPMHGTDADVLLQRADVAMYAAKASGNGVELFADTLEHAGAASLALMGELRRALDAEELVLYFQPQLDLRGGRVHSVEALVRWNHPTRGLIMPDAFVPFAERTGLIRPLTMQIVEMGVKQWAAWRKEGRNLRVAVNLSARNLHDPNLVDEIARMLWRYKVPPGQLELEITESTVMSDTARATEVLPRLRALGVRLSIDDFGTGYSSLAYLKNMPVSQVKIDRAFVNHMAEDRTDAAIVRGTLDLAHSLGLEVVAEGVEDARTCDALTALDCDLAQGWWLSQALPADELGAWLDRRQERAGRGRASGKAEARTLKS